MIDFSLTEDAKLKINGEVLPFIFDFSMILYGPSKIYVKLDKEVVVEANEDLTYHTWTLEAKLPQYSNIFNITGESRFNFSNMELFQDMRVMHGFTYNDVAQFVINFNMETEEGKQAFGVVNETLRQLKLNMKLDNMKHDFE